jgi:hypothetical protein
MVFGLGLRSLQFGVDKDAHYSSNEIKDPRPKTKDQKNQTVGRHDQHGQDNNLRKANLKQMSRDGQAAPGEWRRL